ncbi:hypothetical protein B9Z55_010285 [Caenorhabditis nigoni]|uniref:Tc1-like transposase DDE domain-containing protein n=2 Tax=Caenorhabditis nigoni TaxID=1611254 RepID=A0A2G5UFG7_9PELO|nr:hypothetical protein B9Z55_010285 [Caenorhabditis nigoni]
MLDKNSETIMDTSSTGTQYEPDPTDAHDVFPEIPSHTPRFGPENKFVNSSEEEIKWMRIGRTVCDIDSTSFPKVSTKKYIRNSGEEIMRNVSQVAAMMKESLGSDASSTFLSNTVLATSHICGIGRNTVIRNTPERDEPPRKLLRDMSKAEKCRRYVFQIDKLKRMEIIKKIHQIWNEGKDVNTEELWTWAKEELSFARGKTIFWNTLRGLGFVFRKKEYSSVVEERPDIIQKRATYLKLKKEWDELDAYYGASDETWGHSGMSRRKALQHKNASMYERAKMVDFGAAQPGPDKGYERGKRVIIAALLTELGVVPGSELLLVSGVREEDQMADYHRDMNGENFERYYKEILPLFAEEAKRMGRPPVFICDNAPYHNEALKKNFTASAASKLFGHTRRYEEDVREMSLERELTYEDEDFELLYDVDEDGHLQNIRIADDEEFWSSDASGSDDDVDDYEDDPMAD